MTSIPPLVWELTLDAIQLLVCGGILIYLIRSRQKSDRVGGRESANRGSSNFRAEVMLQVFKQHAQRSFDHLSEALRHERRLFEQFLDQYPWRSTSCEGSTTEIRTGDPTAKSSARNCIQEQDADDREIDRLIRECVEPNQIADRLKIPLEEVHLRLRLSNKPAQPNANHRTPQG